MEKQLRHITSVFLCTCILVGCGQFKAALKTGNVLITDFEGTEILAGDPVYANGSEQLVVAIHLKSSSLVPIPNFRPEIASISGTGLLPTICSLSDSNGVSVCLVKATVAGKKRIQLLNAKAGLEAELTFKAPEALQRLAITPAANSFVQTNNGSKVQLSFGDAVQGVKIRTNGGYQVTLSKQGVAP